MICEFLSSWIFLLHQVNQITSFLDGSGVYGSDNSQSRRLRLGRRGRLRVTRIQSSNGRQLLPLAPSDCADHAKRHYCFAAGNIFHLSLYTT